NLVAARADGWFGHRRTTASGAELRLRAFRAWPLRVQVLDAEGAGVAGVRVSTAPHEAPVLGTPGGPTPEAEFPEYGQWTEAGVSDPEGFARLSPVDTRRLWASGGSAAVSGCFERLEPVVLVEEGIPRADPVLRLPPTVRLDVRVSESDGSPVEGAEVFVRSRAASEGRGIRLAQPMQRTDSRGHAPHFPVEKGLQVDVTALHPAGGSVAGTELLASPEPILIAFPEEGLGLQLALADESGREVDAALATERELAWLLVLASETGEALLIETRARDAAGGRLEVRCHELRAGARATLWVRAEDPAAFARAEFEVPARSSVLEPIDLGRLALTEPIPLVRGRVVDADGRPLKDASLRASLPSENADFYEGESSSRFPRDRTAADGSFELIGPAHGLATVDVVAMHHSRSTPMRHLDVPVGTEGLVLVLREQVRLHGRVVANAALQTQLEHTGVVRLVRADGQRYTSGLDGAGGFEIEEPGWAGSEIVEVGDYRLEVALGSAGPIATFDPVRVHPTGEAECDLGAFDLVGVVQTATVRVVDATGAPVEGAYARVIGPDGRTPIAKLGESARGELAFPVVPEGLDLEVGGLEYPPVPVHDVRADREVVLARGREFVLYWPDMPDLPVGVTVQPYLMPVVDSAQDEVGWPAPRCEPFDEHGESRFVASCYGSARIGFMVFREDNQFVTASWSLIQGNEPFPIVVLDADPARARITLSWPPAVVEGLLEELR
ncbi:MAG TPA: hypothetical protein VJP77_06070, partial [Planctomycetota bacterium]|nr:hypothetical protein [Planctomycetota bacterium]